MYFYSFTTFKTCIPTTLSLFYIQLFRERLSEKVHATNPKGIVGGFELTVFQRNLKEWQERPSAEAVDICLRVLKESNKSRFDSYSVGNSVLIISHITFRDCRVHMFSDNLSRNSCILVYLPSTVCIDGLVLVL